MGSLRKIKIDRNENVKLNDGRGMHLRQLDNEKGLRYFGSPKEKTLLRTSSETP